MTTAYPYLKLGSKGPAVAGLQTKLKAAGYYATGSVDGDFGPRTRAAVLQFQIDRPEIDDDGIVGPATAHALEAAIGAHVPKVPKPARAVVPASDDTWRATVDVVSRITDAKAGAKYGPGRGIWNPKSGKFEIDYPPGRNTMVGDLSRWPNVEGKTYPSFHCSSFTNWIASWILRRNADFTHAGNIPSLTTLCAVDKSIHHNPGAGDYRGFDEDTTPIAPVGRGYLGVSKAVGARDLLDMARAETLPTFVLCAQSTLRKAGGWLWWHHTVLYAARQKRLYRIAADGWKGSRGYSATPLVWREITNLNVDSYSPYAYLAWGIDPNADGTYGDQSRPIADVALIS